MSMTDMSAVKQQYATAEKLNTRISLHSKYSANKQGFGNWIVSHYQFEHGMWVLELGCGTGSVWKEQGKMIRRCGRFILSDFSEGMLNQAKENLCDLQGIEYRQIDIQAIPFPDQSFDAVIANMMLYHVPDLQKGLSEVRRVLKSGGTFYCATYGENGMMKYICDMFRAYHITNQINTNFTLQNGREKLQPYFSEIRRYLYEDALLVTDIDDLVEYIGTLESMSELRKLSKDTLRSELKTHMADGVLRIPKEYGMFEAR